MKSKEELEDILSELLTGFPYEPVNLVYLFGSHAESLKNETPDGSKIGPLSDYDFGVVLSKKDNEINEFNYDKRFKLQSRLSKELSSKVDLVILNEAPIELQYNAISFGIRLYEKTIQNRVEYEARVLGLYGDYLPVLRRHKEELIHGGRNNETRVQRYRKALAEAERVFEQARTSQK